MRRLWRGALVLLLFAALGLAFWVALCRILFDDRHIIGQQGSTGPPNGSGTTFDILSGSTVPAADPYDLARRLRRWQPPQQAPLANPTLPAQVGARDNFWVLDLASSQSYQVAATLRYAGTLANFWVEDGLDVAESALVEWARVFETRVYPAVTAEFGAVPRQATRDGFPLTILNLCLKGAAGYFSSADLYPSSVVPFSNERAMFYMAAGGGEVGSETYNSTLAHELQHMIHWQADSNEESWVNEGLAELAEVLCGYSKAHRIAIFAGHPDIALTQWSANGADASQHYSAAFLFAAYYAQRFGADAVRRLVATEANGIAGYDSVLSALGTGLTFEELFADWAVANYLDGWGSAEQRWTYDKLGVAVQPQAKISAYPARVDATVSPFGTDYVVLEGEGEAVELLFSGEEEAYLVPASARSGTHFWWSNRGDNCDMTLTRAFDLSGLNEAHLQFSLWYDLEDGWDYAYVEASADGKTWQILSGTHTTTSNPTSQSYGPAYTGRSVKDVSSAAAWLEETVDLSDYVGGTIVLRFEYVTDDAVNQAGLCLDDIRIPELGYAHDAEQGDDGWIGCGFVRIENVLPRRYLLQTFAAGKGNLGLERYWVERGRATPLRVVTPAVVTISDVTRFASSPARYELDIESTD